MGEYKSIFKCFNIEKERGADFSETRLSEAVSANLMQQPGSLKDTFDA